jgi:hypothetical protein
MNSLLPKKNIPEQIRYYKSTLVAPGAVVVTEQFVFIGVSSEKVEVNGESVFGISTCPIYANMGIRKEVSFNLMKPTM